MAAFDEIDIDSFGRKIGYRNGKLLQYLDRYVEFMENSYPSIVNFFIGNQEYLQSKHIRKLEELIETSLDISKSTTLNKYKFSMYLDWEINDYLEDLRMEIYRVSKSPKFLRSSITNFNYNSRVEIPSNLGQNQTLEDVSFNTLGQSDYSNRWVDLAMRNDLSELDYDSTGGAPLILMFQVSSRNYEIKSVIDIIRGETILGKDINRKIQFLNDDLLVLNYHQTAKQSVEILANLKRGDIPEFLSLGRSNIVGSSTASIGVATVVRELYNVFSTDDSLSGFKVRNFHQEGSDTFLEFEVSTRIGEIETQSITV